MQGDSMKNTRWMKAGAASGLVLTLALAGCAGGGGDTEGGDAEGGANKTLIVGSSVPKTGPVAAAGIGQACGVEAYFDAVNKAGGINGYDIEVVTKDNQYEGQAAATVAQELVAEGAVAIYAGGTIPIDGARGATQAAGIPLVGAGDGAAFTPPKAPGEFTTYPRYQDDMATAIDFFLNDLDLKSVSAVLALGAGDTSIEAFPEVVEESGAEMGALVQLNLRDPQWAAWAKQLKDAGADAVYVQHVDSTLAQLQKEAANIGYSPVWLLPPFGFGPGYIELAGDLSEGTYVSQWASPSTATDEEAVKKFVEDVEGYSDECAAIVNDANVGTGYNHAAVIAYGIEKASEDGEPTGETITEALQDVDGEAIGTAPSLTFTDDSHAGTTSISFGQVKNGVLEQAGDWREIVAG